MTDFSKTVRIGTRPQYEGASREMSVFCTIRYKDGKLSITGVEGPKSNGDCSGSCGQITLEDGGWTFAPDWTASKVKRLRAIWEIYHLNDMQAGSPRQREFLVSNPVNAIYPETHYTKALKALEAACLSPDVEYEHNGKPYVYGSAWLKMSVPRADLEFLRNLPDADRDMPTAWA